jgi:ankyrin repeat protein
VDARDTRDGQTALHGAAVEGQVKVIEYLVSRGADVNAVDRFGDSPLEVAITGKHNEAAQVLADHGGRSMIPIKWRTAPVEDDG